MAIIYRTAGAWGGGKGVNLTPAELDGNFYEVSERVLALEASGALEPVNIADILVSGSQMTVLMEDGSTFGPFTLPSANFRWRGRWAADTEYLSRDVFYETGGLYVVVTGHESATSFDPDAAEYSKMIADGTEVITVADASGTVTVEPTLAQRGGYFRSLADDGCQVVIPADATVDFPIGTELHFVQVGAAAVEIASESGVTINTKAGSDYSTAGVMSVITVKKVGADEWDLFGDMGTA